MTRKDFIKVAELLGNNQVSDETIAGCCDIFKTLNPRFDAEKFRAHVVNTANEKLWAMEVNVK